MKRSARALAAAALVVAVAACGPPESRPAEGAVAEAIRASFADGDQTFGHGIWDGLLARASRGDRIDYGVLAAARSDLDAYLELVATAELPRLRPRELEALLLNAYNALTARAILDHPGISSIREIDGVWDEQLHRVGGFELTLDAIEHNLLRPFFRDPRIHFAVNCASRSCAPLPPWAFDGERLEEQLDERTRSFLSDPDQIRVEDGVLWASSYFQWYGGDFVDPEWSPRADSLVEFIARFTDAETASWLREHPETPIAFLDYDWSLNSVAESVPDA